MPLNRLIYGKRWSAMEQPGTNGILFILQTATCIQIAFLCEGRMRHQQCALYSAADHNSSTPMSQQTCIQALHHLKRAVAGVTFAIVEDGSLAGPKFSGARLNATLHISWCGRKMKWQVIFHTVPPYLAPDFVFEDDVNFQPLMGSLSQTATAELNQYLLAWGPACSNPQGANTASDLLECIVRVLLQGYAQNHLAQMAHIQHERLQFGVSMLPNLITSDKPLLDLENGDGGETRVAESTPLLQALLIPKPPLACFSIPLGGLDLAKTAEVTLSFKSNTVVAGAVFPPQPHSEMFDSPTILKEVQRLQHHFRLQVAFPLSGSRPVPEFILDVPWELRGPGGPNLPAPPPWDPHSCLMDIIPPIVSRLQPVIDAWAGLATLRHMFLSSLASFMIAPPLELNLIEGSGLWTFTWEGNLLLLTVQCCSPSGPAFPEEKPLLVLTALRTMLMQTATSASSQTYRDYPWSPRWPAAEMAVRIMSFLRSEIPNFLGLRNPAAV